MNNFRGELWKFLCLFKELKVCGLKTQLSVVNRTFFSSSSSFDFFPKATQVDNIRLFFYKFEQCTKERILVAVNMCHILLKTQNIYQPSFGNFGCRLSDSGSVAGPLEVRWGSVAGPLGVRWGSVGGPIGVHLFLNVNGSYSL